MPAARSGSDGGEFQKRSSSGKGAGQGGKWIRSHGSLGRLCGAAGRRGARGAKALATGFTPVESRHLSFVRAFRKTFAFPAT